MISLKRSSALCALVGQVAFLLISAGLADPVMAQSTAATGDGRGTVTEPAYHPVCVTVKATKYLVSTNALNLDPFAVGAGSTGGTFGVLGATGGSSFEPSSSSSSYVSSESLDNSAINAALAACAGTGEAVELALGNGGQRALVVAPFNIRAEPACRSTPASRSRAAATCLITWEAIAEYSPRARAATT
jgi:hypothetical protein